MQTCPIMMVARAGTAFAVEAAHGVDQLVAGQGQNRFVRHDDGELSGGGDPFRFYDQDQMAGISFQRVRQVYARLDQLIIGAICMQCAFEDRFAGGILGIAAPVVSLPLHIGAVLLRRDAKGAHCDRFEVDRVDGESGPGVGIHGGYGVVAACSQKGLRRPDSKLDAQFFRQ